MSHKARVVITDYCKGDLAPERAVLDDIAEVVAADAHSEDELADHVTDADALLVYHFFNITRATIDRLKRCKVIARTGVGYSNVDIDYARERGIPVTNNPDYGTEDVADSAIGMMLTLTRGIHALNSRHRIGGLEWDHVSAAPLYRVRGRVLGIVGLGRIGTAVALRGKAFGMDVVFYDPHRPVGVDKALGIRRAQTLEALLSEAFVVTLHCDLNDETRGLIDADAIGKMPPGSYLVNTARGSVVEAAAVPSALASGQLAGAALDVLPVEPPGDDDPVLVAWRDPAHPAHHNLILTAHTAFYNEDSLLELRRKSAQNCRRAILGEPLLNVVNGLASD
jgi:D-3-phosphoglycerate dehydrogenase/C-terminal binding protein